jgi:hypothetical protein
MLRFKQHSSWVQTHHQLDKALTVLLLVQEITALTFVKHTYLSAIKAGVLLKWVVI